MSFWNRLLRRELSDADIGRRGEEEATRFLRALGFRVMERNWRCSLGEIDLVCAADDHVVFVEVKTSHKLGALPPETRVDTRKRNKLIQLAKYYVKHRHCDLPLRFDVVSVWWENGEPKCVHVINAFDR